MTTILILAPYPDTLVARAHYALLAAHRQMSLAEVGLDARSAFAKPGHEAAMAAQAGCEVILLVGIRRDYLPMSADWPPTFETVGQCIKYCKEKKNDR